MSRLRTVAHVGARHAGAAFLFLHEPFTVKSLAGCLLIGAGALVMAL